MAAEPVVKLTYFKLWGKGGNSVGLALSFAGINWVGEYPSDWKAMKPSTPWRHLSQLEVPGLGKIGHEGAQLLWVGRQSERVRGRTPSDMIISDQLYFQSEHLYTKLADTQDTIFGIKPDGIAEAFWQPCDITSHNKNFTLPAFLQLTEEFYVANGCVDGKFTSTGCTGGECKLFVVLHALVMMSPDVLAPFPGLSAFYDRVLATEEAKALISTGGNFPEPMPQYFIKPSASTE